MADQIYKVRDPEGNIREISGPAGASDNDVIAKAKELFAKIPDKSLAPTVLGDVLVEADREPASTTPSNLQVGINAANKGIAGVPDFFLNTPTNLLNLGKAAYGTAATAFGRPDLAPDLTPNPNLANQAMSAMGFIKPKYEPVTAEQRILDLGIQGAVSAAIPQSSMSNLAKALAVGSVSGGASGGVKELTGNDAAAITAGLLTPAVALKVGGSAAPMVKALKTYGETGFQQAKAAPAALINALKSKPDEMQGMGAASVSDANLRVARALELPAPIKLTKGQAERTFEQQRFERETAKNPELGGQLRQRAIEQNDQILKNFDIFGEQTGSQQSGNLRAIGEIVDKVIVDKSNKAKADIKIAYDKARESGEMRELIPYKQISDYIDSQNPTVRTRLAPVLNSVKQDLKMNDPNGTGLISINALEDIRQNLGKQIQPGTPNMPYGIEVKKLIDATTQNTGGDVYQAARALRTKYSDEFKNVGIINKLLSTKPGGKDRAIALEDVFNDSILKGSFDDVQNVSKTLQTAGDSGKQAWQELQGQFVKNIKDEVTKSVVTNTAGNTIVSPAALDRLVKNLDSDGKLDLMLGKKGAESIRTLNETTKNALVSVPEAVNYSNTASVVLAALDTILSASTGLPAPVLTGGRYLTKKIKERQTGKKIAEALSYGEQGQ